MEPKHRKHRRFRKQFVLLVAAAALLLGAIGGSVAWLTTRTASVENSFTPGEVSCTVEETFNNGTKSDVKVRDTGNTDAFIRAAIVVNWADSNGNVYPAVPTQGTDYSITIGPGWTLHEGYYYYNTSVAETTSTTALINTCTQTEACPGGDQYKLQVTILADAIQSSPATAAQDAWGYVPGQTTGN